MTVKPYKLVNTLDETAWRQFLYQHAWGNIFCTPEMFQVFQRSKGYNPQLWAVIEEDHTQIKVKSFFMPIEVNLFSGPLRFLTTRSVVYGGIVCNEGDNNSVQTIELLLQAYNKQASRKILFTEIRHLFDMQAHYTAFENNNYFYTNYLNYLIYLNKPTSDIWQAISKSCRKRIRKATKTGVKVTEIKDTPLLSTWYGLLEKTYTWANIPIPDLSLFESIFDILTPKGMAKFFLAEVEGQYAACSLEMPYKNIIYSWYAGFDRQYSKFAPNDVLVWHILDWGAKNGFLYYDFGGAGRPDEDYGVRNFKAKFGGELVEYGRHTVVHAPLRLQLSKIGYTFYQHLARLRP